MLMLYQAQNLEKRLKLNLGTNQLYLKNLLQTKLILGTLQLYLSYPENTLKISKSEIGT